jgi:hypothetical protein
MRREIAVKKWIAIGLAVAATLGCVGVPAALAAPTGGLAVFAQCPTHAGGVDGCIYGPVEGGYLTLGKTVMPIAKTMVLQAGLLEEQEPSVKHLAGALNGETLTKVGQPLPGGLFGRPLDAVSELAAPASSISISTGLFGEAMRLTLSIKVRLANPLLGAECTIGSNAHPIELNLTSGTSGRLTGNPGKKSTIEKGRIVLKTGISMVSTGFALPKASGCGSTVADEAIDAKLGLPSSNYTATTFNMKIELANSEFVEEAEGEGFETSRKLTPQLEFGSTQQLFA